MSEQFIGPYRLMSVLGHGPNSIVYKAWQPTVGRPVTLKVLRKPDADGLRRLQAEAHLTANLSDPRVRQVYEVGQTPDAQLYVALQYVDHSLRDLLNQHAAQGEPFSREEVVTLLEPVAGVLDELHRRSLVHLDIKPENILIFKDTRQVVLADFGIVQQIGSATRSGTPMYASPEQAAGNRPVGPWSDVYSLAVVAYEMVAGRPPFVASMDVAILRQHMEDTPTRLRQLRQGIAADLDEAVAKALSKDPQQRFASAGAFAQALEQPSLRQRPLRQHQPLPPRGPAHNSGLTTLGRKLWLGAIPIAIIVVLVLATKWPRQAFPSATPIAPTSGPMETPFVAVAAATATASPTTRPTATTIATAAASPTRTATHPPGQSPTPGRNIVYPAPILVEPAGGAHFPGGNLVDFNWTFNQALKNDERFRFQFWQEKQTVGQAYLTQDTWRHTTAPAGVGTYEWSVDIVRVDQNDQPIQVLSQEGSRRQVIWQ
ncbi:MAG: serine/threonine protein kinase [Thermoflexales bacterium]|nr:serine/threonine protein kinase [Thermoflexales bacterium]